ncbi:NADPH:quinone oxidoreductase family protein [Flexivirga sp. ID2601S]|uniref:NADPH:quinone oxidoreductase family protein n=1 Tax=Flexivirga aerilata TaxID=1656889 RepID=A0A849AKK9_9MICO|nr:NADPH:quinone oxidoreductase family protein [Flexivirga aerilata]NNG38930.1 NADPH:quinone oxidoreductase family protein [Flexivirga aerilata]
MKAWQVQELGDPGDVLQQIELDAPDPGAGQVQVQVRSAALNFPDVLMCQGLYQVRPDLPFTPGVELCGEVTALGEGVERVQVGDRLMGASAIPAGGFAEFALMPATNFKAPESLDDDAAAVLMIAYQTAWAALYRRAELKPGETVLVQSAAGGVGSAAVQLAKIGGNTVIAIVGGAEKAAAAKALGADVVIDRTTEDVVARVKEATGGKGADVIFDPVGGDAYDLLTKCVAFEGRIVLVGFAGGRIQAPPLNHALIKNYSILGLHWGYYNVKRPAVIVEGNEFLTSLADAGRITPLISRRLSFGELPDGLEQLAAGKTIGRLVWHPNP